MEKTKFTILCSLGFGLVFGLFSIFLYYGDWQRSIFVFMVGVFVGLLAAPEFKPKLYKNVTAFQILSGAFSGLFAGLAFGTSAESATIGFLLGGLIGWLAPYWINHVQIP